MTQVILIGEIRFYRESREKQVKPACAVWPKKCRTPGGQETLFSILLRTQSPRFVTDTYLWYTSNELSNVSCGGMEAGRALG